MISASDVAHDHVPPLTVPPATMGRDGPDVSVEAQLMGGRVAIHLGLDPAAAARSGDVVRARADARAILHRLEAWTRRLSRHRTESDLSRLNADPNAEVAIGPTLTAILDWSRAAETGTDGLADVTLLEARLAAEGLVEVSGRRSSGSRAWSLRRGPRGASVQRPAGLRFDLDGVAKGWLADRALALAQDYPSAIIDADGDLAIRHASGRPWHFAVDGPDGGSTPLAVLRLPAGRYGLATSGTSVHRWQVAGQARHHLIDPRTGLSADRDVVQATVLAVSARQAEVLAKAALIAGSAAALRLLERHDVYGALLVTIDGELLATPGTLSWLA